MEKSKYHNLIQKNYMVARALVDTLNSEETRIEQEYIKEHAIKNKDGSIPKNSWMIDNEKVFNKMISDISEEIDGLKIYDAEKILWIAEDELIKFGLSTMPKVYVKERKAIEDACFGLNDEYVHIDIRKRMIELTINLDVKTLHNDICG